MHKITKAVVRGFMSHVNSEFNYAPGLTVVTGPSDAGKSSGVIQPVVWVAFGEPSGEDFLFTVRDDKTKEVIHQADSAEVELHTDDGVVILKTRRKGKTAWYINGKQVSEKAEVPDEVKDVLGLTKQTYGDFETSLNFAYQLEAPFILSESASVGAKVLGKLAGTEIVDRAIAAISKKTYKARDDRNTAQKLIDQVNVDLIEYLQVDEMLAAVQACEALLEQLDHDTLLADTIRQLAARHSVLSDKIADTESQLARLAIIHDLGDFLAIMDKAQETYEAIEQYYNKYKQLEGILASVNARLDLLKNLGYIIPLLDQVAVDYDRYSAIENMFSTWQYYQAKVDAIEGDLVRFKGLPEVKALLDQVDYDEARLGAINDLYGVYNGLVNRIKRQEDFLESCHKLGLVREYLNATVADTDRLDWLNTQVVVLDVTGAKIQQLEARIESFKVLPECNRTLDEIDALYGQITSIKQLMDDYNLKQLAVNQAQQRAGYCAEQKKQAEAELAEAWAAAGDICPLCERPIDGHNHE